MNIQETNNIQNDELVSLGTLTIELHDEHGNLKDLRKVKNTVVTSGKNFIAASMLKTSTNTIPAAMTHMAIGRGIGDAAVTQLDLVTIVGTRTTFSTPAAISSSANNSVVYKADFGSAYSGAITEAAIFNDGSATAAFTGPCYMLCRTTFAAVNKTTNDTITITWTVTIS